MLGQALSHEQTLADLLRRPEVSYENLLALDSGVAPVLDSAIIEQLEIEARYSGYIDRQKDEIAKKRGARR